MTRKLYGGSKVREWSLVKRPKPIIAEISNGNMGQISFRNSGESKVVILEFSVYMQFISIYMNYKFSIIYQAEKRLLHHDHAVYAISLMECN